MANGRKSEARGADEDAGGARTEPGWSAKGSGASGAGDEPLPWQVEVRPARRLLAVLATWAILLASLPGVGRHAGFGHTAFFALIPWAHVCSRPGRRAFWIEYLGAGLGLAGVCWFLAYAVPAAAVIVPFTDAFYMAGAGVLLRVLARRYPLSFAAPAAWVSAEIVRFAMTPPVAWGWHRLGVMAHDSQWMVGSSRVWGAWGLAWCFAAFAGYFADLWRAYRPAGDLRPRRFRNGYVFALGMGPVLVASVLTRVVPAPETAAGPQVLCVQPGIEQEVKSFGADPLADIYRDMVELTAEGLEESRLRGEPVPDLVLWGETMLPVDIAADDVLPAVQGGMQRPEWTRSHLTEGNLRGDQAVEASLVKGVLRGRPDAIHSRLRSVLRRDLGATYERAASGESVLPEGTSFLSGVEQYVVHDGEIRRHNSVAIWDAEGERRGVGGKLYLVPGGETLQGLYRLQFVIDLMLEVGGYIPDFVAAERAGVLAFDGRDGRDWRVGVSVCFDNAFDRPYTEPARRERLDLHVVASNEAWYRDSFEMAHMVAFSRLIAVETGRSVVRATNSGISCVIGPDGRTVGELVVGGHRRMVRGTLAATVPVPVEAAEGRAAAPTPYVRFENWIRLGVLLLTAVACLRARGGVPREGLSSSAA